MTLPESLFSGALVQRLGWALVHFLWQGVAVALLLAGVLACLRRRSAGARYVAATTAMLVLLTLPVATFCLVPAAEPAVETSPKTPAVTQAPRTPTPMPAPSELAGTPIAPDRAPRDTVAPPEAGTDVPAPAAPVVAPPSPPSSPPAPWHERVASSLKPALPWLVAGWVLGVVALSVRLLGGWVQVQRMRRRRVRPLSDRWQQVLGELCRRLRVIRPVRALESALVRVPTTIGYLKPVILLPASALCGLAPEQLQAILAHELAHVRRYDYLVNLLQSVVETLLFYHPAVWWMSHRVRVEREHCCDDLAVAVCGDRIGYAEALTKMEHLRREPFLAVAATGGGSLMNRVRRVVGLSAPSGKRSVGWLAATIAIVTVAIAAIGFQASAQHDAPAPGARPAPPETKDKLAEAERLRQIKIRALEKKIAELSKTRTPQHPEVKRLQDRLAELKAESPATQPQKSPAVLKIEAALAKPVSLDFDQTPLSEMIDFIRAFSGINIALDRMATEDVGITPKTVVTMKFKTVSLRSALALILNQFDLEYVITGNVLMITTSEKAIRLAATGRAHRVTGSPRTKATEAIELALTKPVTVNFEKSPLPEVLDFFRAFSGQNFVLDQKALDDWGKVEDARVDMKLADVSLGAALRLILGRLGLGYRVWHEVILITTKEPIERRIERLTPLVQKAMKGAHALKRKGDPKRALALLQDASRKLAASDDDLKKQPSVISLQRRLHLELKHLHDLIEKGPGPKLGAPVSPSVRQPTPTEAAIETALLKTVSLDFDQTAFSDIVDFLRKFTGQNVVLDVKALNRAGVGPDVAISLKVNDVSLKNALRLMLAQIDAAYIVKNDVLLITSRKAAAEHMVTRVYPVPELWIGFEPAATARPAVLTCQFAGDDDDDDDDDDDRETARRQKYGLQWALVDLIVNTVDPASWVENGGEGTIRIFEPTKSLVIRQTLPNHERVADLIAQLKAARKLVKPGAGAGGSE